MPRLDGTGPNSEGPMTGWGMGNCEPEEEKKDNGEDKKETANNAVRPRRPLGGRGGRRFNRGR
jgi:hypothetical protein